MSDELERLRATGLTQRLNTYGSTMEDLDSSMGAKKLALAEQLQAASKPRENTMQNALIQAVLNLTPALMGYAAAGKEGAYFGLQGGAQGGKIYDETLQKRHDTEVGAKKLEASQTQSELEALAKRKDKLDDRSSSLQDKFLLQDLKEDRSDARTDRLVGAGGFFGRKEGDVADTDVGGSSEGSDSTIDTSALDTDEQILYNFNKTAEGRAFIENDPKLAAKIVDIGNKIKTGQGKDLTNEKSELSLENDKIEKASRESVNDFGFVKAKPTDATNKQQLEEGKKLVAHYKSLYTSLNDMAKIADSRSGIGRTMKGDPNAEMKEARARAAKAYAGLMNAKETDPGKSVYTAKDAESWVPAFGDVGAEIASGIKSLPLTTGANLTQQLEAKISGVSKMLADDLDARGFQVVPENSGSVSSSNALFQDPETGKVYRQNGDTYEEVN